MLGEVGGFSLELFGTTFYPIQVAEKGLVWLRAKYTGQPRATVRCPTPNSAVHKLARAIHRASAKSAHAHAPDRGRAPASSTASPRSCRSRRSSSCASSRCRKCLGHDPRLAHASDDTPAPRVRRHAHEHRVGDGRARGPQDQRDPRRGDPRASTAARLPGQTTADFLRRDPGSSSTTTPKSRFSTRCRPSRPAKDEFQVLARSRSQRHHPGCRPLPYLTPGFTDAKAYQKLGTRCYGFAPVRFRPRRQRGVHQALSWTRRAHPGARASTGASSVLYETVRELAG